ncbi:MAG: DUF2330 domain-containing protein [Deltaproteobacteria bacterium]|nr:DUF2330 domain-containing protein [Deltaproteobacteria bacterium]
MELTHPYEGDDPFALSCAGSRAGSGDDLGASEILDFYVHKGWRFLAIHVDIAQAREEGMLPPLRLTFPADRPVFPLRISAINGLSAVEPEFGTEILLYAVSSTPLAPLDREGEFEFSERFDREDLHDFPAVAAALPPHGIITKHRFWATAKEMTDDIELGPRPETAASIPSRGSSRNGAVLVLAMLAVFVVVSRLRRRAG